MNGYIKAKYGIKSSEHFTRVAHDTPCFDLTQLSNGDYEGYLDLTDSDVDDPYIKRMPQCHPGVVRFRTISQAIKIVS